MSPTGDLFVTTSWWTTWATRESIDPSNIIYLVQEDERRFYPEGDDSIRCAEILEDPRITCIVNSKPLFDYLFAGDTAHLRTPTWFEPAFPAFAIPREASVSGKRNFIFYARPKNLRNLYYRGLEAIAGAIESGTLDPAEWEFFFIGRDLQPVSLPGRNPTHNHRESRLARLSAAAPAHGPGSVADGIAALELPAARPGGGRSGRGHQHVWPVQAITRSVLGKHHLRRPGSPEPGRRHRPGRRTGADVARREANHRNSRFADRLERGLRADLRSARGCAVAPPGHRGARPVNAAAVSGPLGAEHRGTDPPRLRARGAHGRLRL